MKKIELIKKYKFMILGVFFCLIGGAYLLFTINAPVKTMENKSTISSQNNIQIQTIITKYQGKTKQQLEERKTQVLKDLKEVNENLANSQLPADIVNSLIEKKEKLHNEYRELEEAINYIENKGSSNGS